VVLRPALPVARRLAAEAELVAQQAELEQMVEQAAAVSRRAQA
jgi:hypothetical protein